tara:strand:+ start:278 stop:568 length:291 start_codon:yes stop_codon:yes gene_type:complete
MEIPHLYPKVGDFGSVVQPLHPLLQHLYEPVQKFGPTGLPGPDFNKGVVVVAKVHIVEMFKMGRQLLDVRGPTVYAFNGMEGIEELDQVCFASGPK